MAAGSRKEPLLTPVYVVALATFLIVLGLGLTPLTDSGAILISRVFNIIAAAYTIGVASVLRACSSNHISNDRKLRNQPDSLETSSVALMIFQ